MNETLVTWIGNDQAHTVYLIPDSLCEPYVLAHGVILGLNEDTEDTKSVFAVQHFALMTGQEPCFLPSVPSLQEYTKLQSEGPGVPDYGSAACGPPWRRWVIPTLSKGMLKNVTRHLVMGWVL